MDEIKVAGVTYQIKEVPVVEIERDKNFLGFCDHDNTEIHVLDELSDQRKDDVLFHELTHAIFFEAGYDDQDEDMINRVGKVFHQVIKDNFHRKGIA
ncbi:hypothetical protein [Candidatus Enterococcus clewellii]|uniref:IrrE N-terminal-like domain-containing protein n=1 Tax=Candidatus Enterococcus clewellii TaxID=1834193 RepID=A0A242K9D1_9ENTE|nr:hypothetical protein [Enterococcus sp. 9E7_DIV0242]OTP17566.1 hypothetical protein A5888_001704 [Enterococcus sp. 9E7_DIV0242]